MTEVEDDAFNKIKKDNDRLEQEEKAITKAERDAIPKVTSKDISFVIDTICKEANMTRASVRQLFFGMMTAFTKLGMGHKVIRKIQVRESHISQTKLLVIFRTNMYWYWEALQIKRFNIKRASWW